MWSNRVAGLRSRFNRNPGSGPAGAAGLRVSTPGITAVDEGNPAESTARLKWNLGDGNAQGLARGATSE